MMDLLKKDLHILNTSLLYKSVLTQFFNRSFYLLLAVNQLLRDIHLIIKCQYVDYYIKISYNYNIV